MRQIEAAQLMVAMNKYSITYAKSLLGATPQSQLIDTARPKQVEGLYKFFGAGLRQGFSAPGCKLPCGTDDPCIEVPVSRLEQDAGGLASTFIASKFSNKTQIGLV